MLLLLQSAVAAGTEFKSASDTAYLSVVEDGFDDYESGVIEPIRLTITDVASLAVNVSRGETVSLRLVEVSVVTAFGGLSAAGTDTASIALTEVAAVDVATDVTDTTSLTLTDTATADVYDNLLSVTDTASLTLTDSGTVDRRDYGAIEYEDDDTVRIRLEESATVGRYSPVAGARIDIGTWSIRVMIS